MNPRKGQARAADISLEGARRRVYNLLTERLAISTLLQPPTGRIGLLPNSSASTPAFKPPTTKDIPPVTLTNIPHVESAAFKQYLSRIGPLLESLERGKAEAEDVSLRLFKKDREPAKKDDVAEALEKRLLQTPGSPGLSRHGSTAIIPAPESPRHKRGSSGFARRDRNAPTPLSTIPSVYFEDNFQLENPRTFDVVSERAEIVRQPSENSLQKGKVTNGSAPPPRKTLASNAILQERLSWYMDTVEVHLIDSISTASTSFFAALGSLRDLQSEAADSVARIKKLRSDLARLDQEMALGGLKVASMRRRRENIRKLGQATEQLHRVVTSITDCERLVDDGKYNKAAKQMDRIERLISGIPEPEPPDRELSDGTPSREEPLIDLRRLEVLHGLNDGMTQMQYRIGKGFEAQFLDALLSDIQIHVKSVSSRDTLLRWSSASQRTRGDQRKSQVGPPAYFDTTEKLRSELLASLDGLSRAGHTAPATAAFRDAIMREMKALIRRHLPSSDDDDAESVTSVSTRGNKQRSQQEKSSILARNLRALDPDSAEELLVKVYTGVSEALRRLSVQVKVLLDVTSSIGNPSNGSRPQSPPRSPNMLSINAQIQPALPSRAKQLQEELSQALDMSSLLGQAVDAAQSQITKVLKVRTEQTVHLPLQHFLRYFMINRLFADECEAVSGRSGASLKGVINQQITEFLHVFGDAEKQRIAQKLESDQWDAKNFGEEDQAFLSRILDSMTRDPPAWTQGISILDDSPAVDANGPSATNGVQSNGSSGGKDIARSAYIDEQRYIVVDSSVSLLRSLDRFENLIASIPSITSDVALSLADLLRLFNSRTSQLILGAGATRTAGLKNITTKHLALASQALSFVVALIPYIREFLRRHMPPPTSSSSTTATTLAEFDKVKRLFQDHQQGIHDKLVEIMTSRAAAHVKAMAQIDFDTVAKQETSQYIETLVKETSTVHRVLSRHLADGDVAMIMAQVFKSYKDLLGKAFENVKVRTEEGKARLLRDAELFESRLGKIDGFGDLGRTVIHTVRAKSIDSSPEKPVANGRVSTETAKVSGDEAQ
ncbi:hypothetical protein LTR50_001351 [Elasticomyces elasticus]|nr:hypothetical protein LTR50_001351 [Elasticomyces elasticus]